MYKNSKFQIVVTLIVKKLLNSSKEGITVDAIIEVYIQEHITNGATFDVGGLGKRTRRLLRHLHELEIIEITTIKHPTYNTDHLIIKKK